MAEIERLIHKWAPDFARFLTGDEAATAFVSQLCAIAHIWDDLIDRDRPVSDEEINGAFWLALIELPRNPFYQRHFAELQPVMRLVVVNWMAATTLERKGEALPITYVLRSAYIDILTTSALLVGGLQWATAITPEIRKWAHGESFDDYVTALKEESEVRHGRV